MGRSRRSTAAVALMLGCVLSMMTIFVAPVAAASRPPAKPQPTGPTWTAGAGQRLRIEPSRATEGIVVEGVGTFRGVVELVRTAKGIAVVNDVVFEDYVRGISEMPNNWPIEALKAQAIAARTYALWDLRRTTSGAHKAIGADICATQSCQVYTGLTKERAQGGDRWVHAVEATAGQVLWWKQGPINAKYSSSNGGQSVPGGQPYLRAVNDPDDAHSPLHRWQVALTAADVAEALGFPGRQVTAIQRLGDDILVTAKYQPYDPDEEPSHLTLPALDFRDKVNASVPRPENVPRTLPTHRFLPRLVQDPATEQLQVVVEGRGWGHGIGLSQWGAFGKAARGLKAPEILAAYYSGLKPVAAPAGQVPARIKVAVATDLASVAIAPADAGGRMRVSASTGEVFSFGAAERWTVKPVKGTKDALSVVTPAGESAPATVTTTQAAKEFAPGRPVEVRVRLSDDAQVTATATAPGAATPFTIGEPQVFGAGELRLLLPAATVEGDYAVTIDTDRGGGRRTTTTLAVPVTVGPPVAADEGDDNRLESVPVPAGFGAVRGSLSVPLTGTMVAALAILAFLAVALGAARTALGRSAASQLH